MSQWNSYALPTLSVQYRLHTSHVINQSYKIKTLLEVTFRSSRFDRLKAKRGWRNNDVYLQVAIRREGSLSGYGGT